MPIGIHRIDCHRHVAINRNRIASNHQHIEHHRHVLCHRIDIASSFSRPHRIKSIGLAWLPCWMAAQFGYPLLKEAETHGARNRIDIVSDWCCFIDIASTSHRHRKHIAFMTHRHRIASTVRCRYIVKKSHRHRIACGRHVSSLRIASTLCKQSIGIASNRQTQGHA